MSEPDLHDDAVPPGLRIAGAWSWRLLAIAAALGVFGFLVAYLRLLVIPLLIATLLSALLIPLKNWLVRHRWPAGLAVAVTELGVIAVVGALIFLVVAQVRAGYGDLQAKTIASFDEFRDWLSAPPFNVSTNDITGFLNSTFAAFQSNGSGLLSGAVTVGSTVTELLAGVLLTLFATLFILIDGPRIWAWIVRIFPRRARPALDGAGKAGWQTLQNFIRVQILVATVDAIGIGAGAAILQLPLAIPIAVLVFLGSFVPVIGAVATGALAVFVALVYNGWVVALIMLAIVLLVQQIEGHVLQPLVMGTAVKVHPLAVVLAVAGGSVVGGIAGALFAVPIVAVLNVMVGYIARGDWRTPQPTLKDIAPNA